MQIRRRKLIAWIVTLCMTLSIFSGMEPFSLLQASEHQAIVNNGEITFSFTTPGAYAVYLAGSFNGWNPGVDDKDENKAIPLKAQDDEHWQVTLSETDYPELKNSKNEYKFVTYNTIDGAATWEEGSNHTLYREALILEESSLSVLKGSHIDLPDAIYYDEVSQQENSILAKELEYSLVDQIEGVTLGEDSLTVDKDFSESHITLEASYMGLSAEVNITVLSEVLEPIVINQNGTVTINQIYGGETLYFVGDLTSWETNQQAMTKTGNYFTYTTETAVLPGQYGYKFKPNADNWDNNFNADGISGGQNSTLIIPGLMCQDITVEVGKPYTLPSEMDYMASDGEKQTIQVSYELEEQLEGVTLSEQSLTVDESFKTNEFKLKVTGGKVERTLIVTVSNGLYTYKINYLRSNADYTDWNLWLWEDGGNGSGNSFNQGLVEDYIQGIYQAESTRLNFIVRKGEWVEKDTDGDRYIDIPDGEQSVEVWLVQGDTTVYYSKPNISARVENAFMDSEVEVLVNLSESITEANSLVLKDADGEIIETKATKVSDTRIKLTIADGTEIDPTQLYTVGSQVFAKANIQMRGILDNPQYYYDGDDLGLSYSKQSSTFKLWAPTATNVKVSIYDSAEQFQGQETTMIRLSSGVWSLELDGDLEGKYYLYAVSFTDGTTNYVVDPYAKAVSINGGKTAIVNLEETNPSGFDPSAGPRVENATDAIVYELHVRDMSSGAEGEFGEHAGKYLAFTQSGLTTGQGEAIGIDHLKELGITHVQLQPIYDYATVDEEKIDSYNWGYDPQNYNVPEGSYATNPNNPVSRIEEAKAMVKALHDAGIGVIMDVVYNHTYNVENGPFNKIVPGYYYRTDDNGTYTNGSGCGNEIASERPMVRKYIIDSAQYWATEYGIDGFRFDLMGLIDTETMKQVTKVLQEEVNPNVIVYGEPWTGGTSGLASESQTLKGSQKETDFGVFNDNIRSAIKGDSDGAGTGFATGSTGQEADIIEGVQGAIHTIATHPTEVVSYITAHDNLNLWDKVLTTMNLDTGNPYSSIIEKNILDNEAVKRDLLANGIVFTSQGVSFMHAGEEFLRTKYGDSNSYKSPDSINQIVWENKEAYKPVFEYYQGLIALRKAHPAFRMATADMVEAHFEALTQSENVVAFTLKDYANGDTWNNIVVIYNANEKAQTVALPSTADWKVVVDDTKAGNTVLETLTKVHQVEVAPLSMMVLYDEAVEYEPVVTKLVPSEKTIGMAVGNSKLLKVTVKDQNGATILGKHLTYSSSDEEVLQVTSNGQIKAIKEGSAEVIVSCESVSCIIPVTVVDALIPTQLTVTGSKTYVYESKSLQLRSTVYDQFNHEMLDAKVKWSSSDTNKATVDAYGKVTGLAEGVVMITATCGNLSESYALYVKTYEKRYIIFEYIREDQTYDDWNLWTWSTGVSDGQVDFTTIKDGKAIAYIEIGPDTQSMGYIVRKGTDWSNCKQDITADRYVYTDVDQTITKVRVYAMVNETETLASALAPVINPEEDSITFYYRNTALFKEDKMETLQGVQIEINDKLYDMTYDAKNELYIYTYKGLEEGKYYYCYHVTNEDGTKSVSLDSNNPLIENQLSVLNYQKYDITVEAHVAPGHFNYRESAILEVKVTCEEEVTLKKMVANLSALGGNEEVEIDESVMALSLSVSDKIVSGEKEIPIKVYDEYGNVYKTVANVVVDEAPSTEDFDWDEAVIYFMLTDRFYNGESSNDDPLGIGYDKNVSGSYHGGDFKGITEKMAYLEELGINTIWISPIVEQIGQNIGDSSNCYYAYHGYWTKDFEALNPHFGSLDDLKEMIDVAHEHGIKVMVDVVINHAGYGLKEGEQSSDPNFPTAEEQAKFNGMFRTDGSTDTVYGEISGLPDFITEDESVRQTVLSWQTAWIEKCTTDKGNTIDYFRIDTAKHLDKATLAALKVAATSMKADFKYILEAWYSGSDLDAYLNNGLADGVLNFDFKEIAKQFVNGNLESAEASLEALNEKNTSSSTYGNFLGSHDEDGFLYTIGKENIGGLLTAVTLQATSKGQPVIYYGEELGQSGANNYPQYDNRYDMDWNQVTEDNFILKHYQKLLNIRKEYSKVFAKGTRELIAGGDEAGYIAFTRQYQDKQVIVVVNGGEEKELTIQVPFSTDTTIVDLYSDTQYTLEQNQILQITLPSSKLGGTIILVPIDSNQEQDKEDQPVDTPTDDKGDGDKEDSDKEDSDKEDSDKEDDDDDNQKGDNKQESNKASNKGSDYTPHKVDNIIKKSFSDVASTHWAKEYIDKLVKKEIIQGRPDGTFGPSDNVTRAELVLIIARAFNLISSEHQEIGFKDVAAESWYSMAISSLASKQIVMGYEDQSFRPNQTMTRQELATVMIRVYNYLVEESNVDLKAASFEDAKEISLWATESVQMAQALGIIQGNEKNEFLPKELATRAEVAKILCKLIEVVEQ